MQMIFLEPNALKKMLLLHPPSINELYLDVMEFILSTRINQDEDLHRNMSPKKLIN